MIPILYESNESNFNHNGICSLYGLLDYEVTEARNGEFELELIYPVDGLWFSELTDFRIISAEPNEIDEPHRFRIYEIKKSLDEQTVIVYASTATNDLGGNLVEKVVISDEIPQQAMDKMKAALLEPTNYNFVSDIQTTSSTEWERRNPLNCIAGEAGSLIAYWGGEVKRTNDTIYLYSRRGKDNVTTIRPGKNLSGFEMTVSTKGLITAILPYFRYIPENETDYVTVYGTVVRSPLENNYPIHKITPVDFSSDESITTVEDLNAEAARYFTYINPDCDKPKVNLEIDLMQLSDSAEYAKFKSLERIGLTDTVTVWVEKFDIDVVVKVTEVTYNGMKRMVTKLVAGTPSVKFYDDVRNTYQTDINYLKDYVDSMENGVRNQIQLTADGKNTIFRGYTEPSADIAKVNDLWYKQLGGGAVEMMQFDGAYWQPLKVTDDVFAEEMSITKFTAGTLNAELVNLVNMNASNITTGTLTGVNMWLNLLTGEMQFTNPDTGDLMTLKQGRLQYQTGDSIYYQYYDANGLTVKPSDGNTGDGLNTGMTLIGNKTYFDFLKTGSTTDFDVRFIYNEADLPDALQIWNLKGGIYLRLANSIPVRIQDNYVSFVTGDKATTFQTDGFLRCGHIAQNTTSATSNVHIRSDGIMFMIGSASKYKSDIQLLENEVEYAKRILDLHPKSWIDKGEQERADVRGRYYGVIAEDVEELGLLEYTTKNEDGELESVQYDRLWTLLLPIVREQDSEIKNLKQELADLKTLLTERGVI